LTFSARLKTTMARSSVHLFDKVIAAQRRLDKPSPPTVFIIPSRYIHNYLSTLSKHLP
jgi:hypothetical protein